jgi:hypothetical protein
MHLCECDGVTSLVRSSNYSIGRCRPSLFCAIRYTDPFAASADMDEILHLMEYEKNTSLYGYKQLIFNGHKQP